MGCVALTVQGRETGSVLVELVPLTQRQAAEAVTRWHRHNAVPRGDLFRVGLADPDGVLVAVGIAGRPVARHFQDGRTVEVTRVASNGSRNANSQLYGALTRAAFALGYRRVVTYTQESESGASLRAAGFRVVAELPARSGWHTMARPRDDARYLISARTLWDITAAE